MPGPNTSGLPSTEDYLLGRGILYAAELNEAGFPKEWRDLGNCTEFALSVEVETLEHQSSRTGLRTTDKEIVLSQDVSYSFTLDEINSENFALFVSGEVTTQTNPAVAGFTNDTLVPVAQGLVKGRWYDLVTTAGVRAYDVDPSDLTVERDPLGTPAVLVNGVAGVGDYILDSEFGRIFFHETSNTVALVAGDAIGVTVAAEATAGTPDVVNGLTSTSKIVALKFIGENPAADGEKYEVQIQKTTLRAEGDFALISDDWTTMGFAGAAERNSAYPAGQQYFRKVTLPA